jgi:hypothetical protein
MHTCEHEEWYYNRKNIPIVYTLGSNKTFTEPNAWRMVTHDYNICLLTRSLGIPAKLAGVFS